MSGKGREPFWRKSPFALSKRSGSMSSERSSSLAASVNAVEERVCELLAAGIFLEPPGLRASLPAGARWRVDTTALPPGLADKVTAREAIFGGFPPPLVPGYREDPSLKMPKPVVAFLRGLVLLPFPLGAGIIVVDVTGPFAACMTFAPWTLAAVAFLDNWVRKYRGPLALTRAEARLTRQHTMHISPWPVPFLIARQENALQVAAMELIAEIRKSRAWKSEHFDLHRIRLDLDEEAFQITESCLNLVKLGDFIDEVKPTDTPSSSTTRRKLDSTTAEYETYYVEANQAVVNRIAALYMYRTKLEHVETLLDDIDKASTLAVLSDDFTSTFTAIVRDGEAATHTRQLAGELAALQDRLETELAFISGHIIDAPSLTAPLILADSPASKAAEDARLEAGADRSASPGTAKSPE
jgi:hypothetical protein